ncbi:hypothetical protein MMC30_006915 [Trapelia coarctata]|nr:hypothetical protein [Trapelia coarctata]
MPREEADPGHTTIWMGSHTHCVVYVIPGHGGSLTPGERMVNLCWYCNYPEDSQELGNILTDASNHRHRNTIAAGKLRDEVWQKQKKYVLDTLPAPFAELISKINQPFVQTISDAISPQASFFDGKLLLVGDALTLFRPHAALGTDQAAMNCLALEKVLRGEMDMAEWEREVLVYGYTTWRSSRAMGAFYQFGPLQWIPSALQVLVALAGQRMSKLWYGSKL